MVNLTLVSSPGEEASAFLPAIVFHCYQIFCMCVFSDHSSCDYRGEYLLCS